MENGTAIPLIAVHVCRSCGAVVRRSDAAGAPNASGIFRCPVCSAEGPLNLQVQPSSRTDKSDPD